MVKHKIDKTKLIITASLLAAFSFLIQLMPFWPTTWGMRIDLVAVPWLISLFLLGIEGGLISAFSASFFIGLAAVAGYLGAGMKLISTLPLILFLGIGSKFKGRKKHYWYLLSFLFAVFIRCILMVYVNYYFALPIWMSMTTEEIFAAVPVYWIIVPNIIQSIIDFGIAWLIVFRTPLKERVMN